MKAAQAGGQIDVLLLAVLSSGPAHGYAIIEELGRRSGGRLEIAEGTVYPALHRLEADGLLKSDWTQDAPRRRRTYELTRRGRGRLEVRREAWREFATAVEAVLEGSACPARTA